MPHTIDFHCTMVDWNDQPEFYDGIGRDLRRSWTRALVETHTDLHSWKVALGIFHQSTEKIASKWDAFTSMGDMCIHTGGSSDLRIRRYVPYRAEVWRFIAKKRELDGSSIRIYCDV
jgi:hypothetical protein